MKKETSTSQTDKSKKFVFVTEPDKSSKTFNSIEEWKNYINSNYQK